jgi:peptide alpha-N-acetyltransferase
VQGLVQEVLTELLGGAADIQAYTAAYAQRHSSSSSSSLRQQAAGVEMAALLDPASKAAGIKQLLAAGPDAAAGSGAAQQQLADCIEVHRLLLSGPLADAAAAGEWKQRCAAAFAHSSYFGGAAATPADKLKLNPADLKQPLAA